MSIRTSVLVGELPLSVASTPIVSAIARAEGAPAVDNMRVDSQVSVAIDTITLKFRCTVSTGALAEWTARVGGNNLLKQWQTSRLGVDIIHRSYEGGLHYEEHSRESSVVATFVTLGGKVIRSLGTVRFFCELEFAWRELSASCSRIDVCADLVDDSAIPTDYIRSMIERGMTVGYKNVREISTLQGRKKGTTFYFGSTKAEKMLRIYDKSAEEGHDYPWSRIELQCRGRIAKGFLECYMTKSVDERAGYLASTVAGAVDFRHRVDKNLDRCPRDVDWIRITLSISESRVVLVAPKRPPLKVIESIGWVFRAVSRTLARIEEAMGDRSFSELVSVLLSVGASKLTDHDYYLCDLYRQIV